MAKKFPDAFYNPLSIIGAVLALIIFITFFFLVLIGIFVPDTPVYFGIVTFIILPVFLILSLILVIVGIVKERKRLLKGERIKHFISIDLNNPKHRRGIITFLIVVIIFMLSSAFGSYQAFQYSESVEFCGKLCHEVMEPEYTAYQTSPHARVRCAECHIGEGADWFVKSKLSGAYQVYSVLFNKYSRPIPTPIKNLRPAQETCERCHWPQYFFSEKKIQKTYFKKDEKNSPWTVSLLMKIGGGSPEMGPTAGIHWHMNINRNIEYIAKDRMRQEILYVKATDRSGNVTEYLSSDEPLTREQIDSLPKFRVDCIDCHNRPSHVYNPPTSSVDMALYLNRIDPALPFIKKISVEALSQSYSTKKMALDSIRYIIENFYGSEYKEVVEKKSDKIKQAILELQKIYSRNFFPRMNVSWRAYPNNIAHLTNPGCFRCHNDKLVNALGKSITKDCNSCHTILYQGVEVTPKTLTTTGLDFIHPEDIGDEWKTTNCNECHTGD